MSTADDPIITIGDVRRAGHCVSGTRRWFEAHNLDFKQFLTSGIRASEMAGTGDALGIRVVEFVKNDRGGA